MKHMIITIDGPAGSGKSTAARKLAARLEIAYLDTGAMYRAIAWAALKRGIDLADPQALLVVARDADLELDCGPTHTRVRVDGHDVSEAIRSLEVSSVTSRVAVCQPIRSILVERQRRIARQLKSCVSEGRDQGSVVFPDADMKFVLDADIDTRARRRYLEMQAEGESVSVDAIRHNLRSRDDVDARQWEALLAPGAAVVIDTSNMSIHDVIERMVEELQRATAANGT